MADNNPILKTLALANTGKRYPVMQLVGDNPEQAALISKLIAPQQPPQHNQRGQREIQTPNAHELRAVSNRTARNITDAQTVMQLLPDIELSAQILVSSILSPKDMMTTELLYTGPEDVVSTQISTELIVAIRKHFEQDYKIKNKLHDILRDVLFEKGSHVLAVLPENSLDELINRGTAVTMESIAELADVNGMLRPLGLLGNPDTTSRQEPSNGSVSMEDFKEYKFSSAGYVHQATSIATEGMQAVELGYNVIDNPNLLKYPRVVEKIRAQRVRSAISGLGQLRTGMESRIDNSKKLSEREMASALYKRSGTHSEMVSVMRTQEQLKRKTLGNPLVLELPPESVIPVHVPGQEDKHVAYFVLVDGNGNPIKSSASQDHYADLAQRMGQGSSGSFPSTLISRVQAQMNGFDCMNAAHLDYSTKVYADMVEQDLMARLKNGVYTNGVALARNEEVYRIMLSRALASKRTQLLFLPVEMVTYFAFRYNGDGIGKSIMDDQKILNSLRAMLMFSNTMASVRNSIGLTTVNLKLDEQDVDPQKTIERVMDEIVRAKAQAFPLGVNSPVDLTNWLQRAGYQFTFEGHPGLPDMKIEQTESNTNYPKVDTELEENLRKRSIMATGLNPETVDNGFAGELATSVVANNILLSRRVMQLQEKFCPMIADHAQKKIFATQGLLDELRDIVMTGYDALKLEQDFILQIAGGAADQKAVMVDYLLNEYIRKLEVGLPRPNTVTAANQLAAMSAFTDLLDPMLDAFISDQFFTADVGGDAANSVAAARAVLRAYFVRRYASENGILPELFEITSDDENGKSKINLWEDQEKHIGGLIKSMTKLLVGLQPLKDSSNKLLAEQGAGGDGGFGGGGTPDYSGGDTGGGSDPFGGDFGSVDEPPADEPLDEPSTDDPATAEDAPPADSTNLNGEDAPAADPV